MDLHVGSVGDVEVFLLRVARQRYIEGRTVAQGILGDELFLDVGTVGLEDLDAVIGAVACIHEPVIG